MNNTNDCLQEGENVKLSGAVSLANPLDLILGDRNFAKGFNQIYTRRLAQSINNFFMKCVRYLPVDVR